jgi:hypothetical protein
MEVASNIQPKKFGLNVRRNGPQPSIFVRSFSPITTRDRPSQGIGVARPKEPNV